MDIFEVMKFVLFCFIGTLKDFYIPICIFLLGWFIFYKIYDNIQRRKEEKYK